MYRILKLFTISLEIHFTWYNSIQCRMYSCVPQILHSRLNISNTFHIYCIISQVLPTYVKHYIYLLVNIYGNIIRISFTLKFTQCIPHFVPLVATWGHGAPQYVFPSQYAITNCFLFSCTYVFFIHIFVSKS